MITMKEIAEKSGVSRTTVSFVLNGRCHLDQRVSQAVEKKVLDTANELGYVRNDLVLSLVKGRSRAIGIVSSFQDFMFPIIRGYAQEAQNHGYSIRLFQLDGDINKALMKAVQNRVDAVVCLALANDTAEQVEARFFHMGIPITGLGQEGSFKGSSFDQQGSAARMTEYLVGCGYRKIICYGGNYRQMSLRETGYREVMEKHRLVPVCLNFQKVTPDELIDEKPDAVFCGDDFRACLLLQSAYRRNIRVPEVFGVSGFGNTMASQYSSPPLTTVNEPYFETGVIGCRRMISMIEKGTASEHSPISGELVIRESTRSILAEKS